MVAHLDQNLARYGFEKVRLDDLSMEEQVDLFRHATHIAAAHGAGLSNIVFAERGVHVLELNLDLDGRGAVRPWFFLMACAQGMHYQCLDYSRGEMTEAHLNEAFRRLVEPPGGRLARSVKRLRNGALRLIGALRSRSRAQR